MEIPVSGYMYHPGGSDSYHSHNLYITSWDGKPVHTHNFSGVTSYDVGHNHKFIGKTAPAPSGVQHTHRYFTFTSFDDGHKHVIKGVTGPAIFLPNGGHIHNFRGMSTVDGRIPHSHKYYGKTSP
jgi:hypothetical protein